MNYLILFGALMLVHLLYDFHWQGEFIGGGKSKYTFLLHVHCLTWTLCISAVLYQFDLLTIGKIAFLYITHFVIDYWKCRKEDKTNNLTFDLWIDQFLHVLTLIGVMFIWGI